VNYLLTQTGINVTLHDVLRASSPIIRDSLLREASSDVKAQWDTVKASQEQTLSGVSDVLRITKRYLTASGEFCYDCILKKPNFNGELSAKRFWHELDKEAKDKYAQRNPNAYDDELTKHQLRQRGKSGSAVERKIELDQRAEDESAELDHKSHLTAKRRKVKTRLTLVTIDNKHRKNKRRQLRRANQFRASLHSADSDGDDDLPAVAEKPSKPGKRKRYAVVSYADATSAEESVSSLDNDFSGDLKENAALIANFPQAPTLDRIRASVAGYLQRMSPERFARTACAICGTAAALAETKQYNVEKKTASHAKLPAKLREAMTAHLTDMSGFREEDLCALPAAFADFESLALERRGLDFALKTLTVCNECERCLTQEDSKPPFSVANSFKFGEIPEALQGLRWVELRLIQAYRTVIYVMHLNANSDVSADDTKMQQKVRHVCVSCE